MKLKFVDLKTKKIFFTDNFEIITKKGRKMAVTTAPSGIKSSRFVVKDFKK